jgi:uncharacterized membrane protein
MYSIIGTIFWLVILYFIVRRFFGHKKKHYSWLQNQIVIWENKKLISAEQGTAILAAYNLQRVDTSKKMDTVKVLTLIGAIFVGLGVIFMVASNWQEIPKIVRTIMLLGITLGTLYAGYYLSYERTDYPLLGKSLFLLAGLFWGGTIALIAQIYNIPTSKNWFILLIWAFPILPVAYFFENEYTYILSSALFLIWNFTYSTSNNVANYYYPLLVFLMLLPMANMFIKWEWVNVLGLIIAALYGVFLKYEYLVLISSVGFLVYYLWFRKQELYLLASSLCFSIWLVTFFLIREAVPNYYFLIPLSMLFYLSYQAKSRVAVALNLASALVWLNLILAVYMNISRQSYNIISFSLLHSLIGIILFAIGMLHKDWNEEYSPLYKITGFALCFVFVYILSFKQIFASVNLPEPGLFFITSLLIFAVFLMLMTVLGLKGRFSIKSGKLELIGLLLSVSGSMLILLNPAQALLNTVIANIVLIVFAVLCIFGGVEDQNPSLFNSGIAFFVLFIITRYIDIFWKLQEKSIFFLTSGIILIFGGMYLEKKRRQIIERMKG